jgi:hypothetical protein
LIIESGFYPKGEGMSTADSTTSTTDERDIYDQVMVEIEAGSVNQAVEMIMALEGRDRQMEILSRLVGTLDKALDIRGASTLDLDRARALMRSRDRALELKQSLDLEHAQALEESFDRARALYLNLDSATHINRTIMGCLSKMDGVPAMRTLSATAQNGHWGRVVIISLICIVICIVIAWMLLLRAQNGAL